MTDDSWEITIHPTKDGVRLRFEALRKIWPDQVFNFYMDLLATVIPEHDDHYRVDYEDDDITIIPHNGLIKNPLEFAGFQVEVQKLAECFADTFDVGFKSGLFRAESSDTE